MNTIPVPDMTLRQIYKNTIQTAIDVIQDTSDILSEKPYMSDTTLRRRLVKVSRNIKGNV